MRATIVQNYQRNKERFLEEKYNMIVKNSTQLTPTTSMLDSIS